MLENGKEICDCKKKNCKRHGNCAACIEYHQGSKYSPYCKREKKSLLQKLTLSNNYKNGRCDNNGE